MIEQGPVEITNGTVVQTRPLTSQEDLLLHDRRMTVAMIDKAGDHLDSKALGLLQAASLVLALVAVLGLPDRLASLSGVGLLGLIIALLAFGSMIVLAVIAWYPRPYFAPGSKDWDQVWSKYIVADTTSVYLQVISNYDRLIEVLDVRNRIKGQALIGAAIVFVFQIVGLLILALAG